jgi:lysyl-tRNA synthetase class 1
VELAARWKALRVTFEPFGKDHTSRGGSTDTADRMAREVFHYPPPGRYEYEWIQIKGRGAMSSSKGIVLLPNDMLDIMPPDALRRMVLGRDPARALDLDLSEGFPRFMDEYRASVGDEPVPFAHLVLVDQTVGSDPERAAAMLRRGGYGITVGNTAKLQEDLTYARNWAEKWAPEQLKLKVLDLPEAREAARNLSEEQRQFLRYVAGHLGSISYDADTIQNFLYAAAEHVGLKPKQAFAAIYTVLLGEKSGPKAGPFIASFQPQVVQERFLV